MIVYDLKGWITIKISRCFLSGRSACRRHKHLLLIIYNNDVVSNLLQVISILTSRECFCSERHLLCRSASVHSVDVYIFLYASI